MRKTVLMFRPRPPQTALYSHRRVRGAKFGIQEVDEFYYLCSENKDANQLQGYRPADLRLCFSICKKQVFSCWGSYSFQNFKALTGFCSLLDQFESNLPPRL